MPQKNWDKHEVALLIEVYQNIKHGKEDKDSALVALSQNLRKMAQNDGFAVDEAFRNLNGVQWQLGYIERAFLGKDDENRTPPRVFVEMVDIYNQNQQEFQTILAEAHQKIENDRDTVVDKRKEVFGKWLIEQMDFSSSAINAAIDNINRVSIYANEKDVTKRSFWCFDSYKEFNIIRVKISGDRLFRLTHGKEHRQFEKIGKMYSDFLRKEEERIAISKQPNEIQVEPPITIVSTDDLNQEAELVESKTKKRRVRKKEIIICPEDLKALLLKKFSYGIRVDSSIDIMKLRSFAEMFDVVLTEDEDLLKAQVIAAGIAYEGKTYFISEETFKSLIEKINSIVAQGYSVIYYEEVLNKHFTWFDDNHISSWELIREILYRRSTGMYISKNFLRQGAERINEADAVEIEIEKVWGDHVIHTYDEVYELLPYIPNEKIKFYLSYCTKFVWSTNETFAWIDKVVISDEDRQAIVDYVMAECELKGHVSIANVPLGSIEEENYEISITAIHNAIYNLVLKDDFSINGKILTNKNSEVDALTLARLFCADKDVCTFTELNDYVISINGTANRQISLRAAYDQLVRIEEDKFVADNKVDFDINAVDQILEQSIANDFAPIKSIATFIMFPNCGYTWTHYILESFCYRFSKKFRLEVINLNDKNAGIIVKKEVNLSYMDMLAIAAANSKLELEPDIIGQYLFDSGYTARRKAPIIDSAIEKAKLIREGR